MAHFEAMNASEDPLGKVAEILAEEIRRKKPDAAIVSLPVADGGEGTVDAFFAALSNTGKAPERIRRQVIGPFGGLVAAEYLIYRRAFGPSRKLLILTFCANVLSFFIGALVYNIF